MLFLLLLLLVIVIVEEEKELYLVLEDCREVDCVLEWCVALISHYQRLMSNNSRRGFCSTMPHA